MAAIFLTCCGLVSTRLDKKRKDRQEREKDYSEHFEELKAANAARVRQLSNTGIDCNSNTTNTTNNNSSDINGVSSMPSNAISSRPGSTFVGGVHTGLGGHSRGNSWDSAGAGSTDLRRNESQVELYGTRTPPSYEDVVGQQPVA